MSRTTSQRLRDPLVLLLIAAGLVFGLGPLLVPKTFADLTGFLGTDTLLTRLAGAATLGYGVGLLIAFRAAWRVIWIAGEGQPVADPILGTAGLVTVGTALALVRSGR